MVGVVADTSALVSLGVVSTATPNPLTLCLHEYEVFIPDAVVGELHEIASYDDEHGNAATAVHDQIAEVTVHSVELDATFPLDDGENAAVTLTNDLDVALFLCDAFNSLGLIHASLADTRLVTTPTLLSVFVRTGQLTPDEARSFLDDISTARSWDTNSYVQRARSLLDKS